MEQLKIDDVKVRSPEQSCAQLKNKCSRYWGRMFAILRPVGSLPGQLSGVLYDLLSRFFDYVEKVNRENRKALYESSRSTEVLGKERKVRKIS